MEERPSLLFCDTFVNEGEDDIRLDMVGFSRPVAISEIRVIPHGCKVHPEIRDRLGETNPSSFKLELFIKNLTKPNATVFEILGILDYEQGKSIQQIVNSKVATNVVLVRGWYRSLTVSLYGTFSNFQPDQSQVPPPPPMDTTRTLPVGIDGHVQVSVPPITHTLSNAVIPPLPPSIYIPTQTLDGQLPPNAIPAHLDPVGYGSPNFGNRSPHSDLERRDLNNFRRGMEQQLDNDEQRRIHDEEQRGGRRDYYGQRDDENYIRDQQRDRLSARHGRDEQYTLKTGTDVPAQPIVPSEELFEPLSPETDFFDNPQEELNGKKAGEPEQIGYEDIESDEDDMLEDFDFEDHNLQNEFDTDETWASISLSFNPYQCSLSPLESIPSFGGTDFEKMLNNFKTNKDLEPPQVKQLQDHIVSDSEAERDSKWVTMLEELPIIIPTAMAYLHSHPSQKIKERHFLSIITEWAVFGLNMDNALTLPLAVNIRFLKASIKLTCLLAGSCNEYQRMLIEIDVQERLIELLKTNHMASSLKLLILKALDETTNTAFGMENFLGWNLEPSENDEEMPSVYEELVLYLLGQPTVRIIASIKALLSKAHFYESLSTLQSICGKISESPVKVILEETEEEKIKDEDSVDGEAKTAKKSIELDISDRDISNLLSSLHHIYKIIEHGNSLITQPCLQSFPTTARLQDKPMADCFATITKLLSSRRFLESILVLISSPLLCEPGLYIAVRDILFLLMSSDKGLLYISSHPNTANGLVRVLLNSSESEGEFTDTPSLSQCAMNDDIAEGCTPLHLGLLLVYHLQTIQGVDQLLETAKPNLSLGELDSADHISMLHTLYAMTYTTAGRDAVTSTLSHGRNLKCLLPFLTGDDDFEIKVKKSVSSKYAAVLLSLTLQHSDNIGYLEMFGTKLLKIPKKDNDRTQEDIHNFLAPLEKVSSFDLHDITNLLDFIKSEVEDMKLGSGGTKSILTALRLLKYFAHTTENKDNSQKDLQWRLSVIQMFSSNAMGVFILVFHKIAEQLLTPWKLSEPFSNNQISIFVTTTLLLLQLTDTLLSHLLSTSFCFKDGRLAQELFSLHKILCSKPPVGPLACILTTIQEQIIELLIKFMKGTTDAPESEESVKSSTWYILLKELLTFSVAKPENFVTGLVLLSELLPTPLPIHTLHNIGDSELSQIMNHRLFAMANFSCLSSELKLMLRTVIASCSSTLQYYLRRVMCQLIDLGSSVAGLVLRTLCELVDEGINKANREAEENVEVDGDQAKKKFLPWTFYNTFSLLSYLACQPSGKAAFLNLLITTKDSVTEFPDFIDKLIALQQKENGLSYLENSLLPLLLSICDHEVCLEVFNGTITLQHLSNSLPIEQTLQNIVEFLFSLISSENISIHVVIRSLNILESLTDHDYGMIIIKQFLAAKGCCLTILLDRMVTNVENKSELSLVFNAISTFIEFLNLTNSPGPENYMKAETEDVKMEDDDDKPIEAGQIGSDSTGDNISKIKADTPLQRSVFIDANMLKNIFNLDDKNISGHALTKLEKLIEDEGQDEEELVSLSQAITTLRMIMIAGEQKLPDSEVDKQMETLPADPLQVQFASRLTMLRMNTIHDDRASNNDWFDAAAPDEIDSDSDVENVRVDLLAISEKFLPNFKFKEEIEKGFIDTAEIKRSKRSKRNGFFRAGDHIEDSKRRRFDVSALSAQQIRNPNGRGANRGLSKGFFGRGFNRGFTRGFGRGFNRGRGRGRGGDVDMFRQRRQNTSRPPSMHVDDFINMEKTGETMMAHSVAPEVSNIQTSSVDRFTNNFIGNSQARWSNNQTAGGFRRTNNEAIPTIQTSRSGPYDYNNSRMQYSGGKFNNRTGSDWNNTNYRGSREPNYTRAPSMRGGGYWAGPKPKEDNRFFPANNYRQFSRGGRHQRTFTR